MRKIPGGFGNRSLKREDKDKGKYRDKEGRLWNRHPLVVRFTEEEKIMRPYLDDFAQMAGTGLKVAEEASPDEIKTAEERGIPLLIKGKGLLCAAGRHEDEKALFYCRGKKTAEPFTAREREKEGLWIRKTVCS